MSIQDFFDSCENDLELVSSCSINWSVKGTGFGNLQLYVGQDGNTWIQNEGMGKEFIKKILCDLVDDATLEDERPIKPVITLAEKVCANNAYGPVTPPNVRS